MKYQEKDGLVKIGKKWMSKKKAKPFMIPHKIRNEFQEICRLSKKRSPYLKVYKFDPLNLVDDDDWFVTVCQVRKKDGVIKSSDTIIRKDVGGSILYSKNMLGFDNIEWDKKYSDPKLQEKMFGYKE